MDRFVPTYDSICGSALPAYLGYGAPSFGADRRVFLLASPHEGKIAGFGQSHEPAFATAIEDDILLVAIPLAETFIAGLVSKVLPAKPVRIRDLCRVGIV